MGVRGELFTTQTILENRSYFFNVKENRTGDIFLQIVESKSRDGGDFDRHQIAVFAEDMQDFFQGLDKSLAFIEQERKHRQRVAREKREEKEAKYKSKAYAAREDEGRKPDGIKRTGRIHVVSKRTPLESENNEVQDE